MMGGLPPTLSVVVVDCGIGNLRSVSRAFEAVGAHVSLAPSPDALTAADALVFPGQGAIGDCMRALRTSGWDAAIGDWIGRDRPFFGVCLGLQVLFDYSEEGDCAGLGIFPGKVQRFRLPTRYKIPHIGWNQVRFVPDAPLCNNIDTSGEAFYFVHSYYVTSEDKSLVWAESDYGIPFISAIRRGNCFATQFHPEKSQAKGLQIYKNFLQWVNQIGQP